MVYYVKYKNLKRVKRVSSYYSEDEVAHAIKNPCIIHFTTCFMDGTRPWMENNFHPMLDKYLNFKSESPWADEPLWKDPRNKVKKTAYTSSIGFVHGVLIPMKNKRKNKAEV